MKCECHVDNMWLFSMCQTPSKPQLPKLLSNPDYHVMSVVYKTALYVKFKKPSQHPPPKSVLKSHLIGTNYLAKNIQMPNKLP